MPLADQQGRDGPQLLLPREGHDELARSAAQLPLDPGVVEVGAHGRLRRGAPWLAGHGIRAAGAWTTAANGSIGVGFRTRRASAYTSSRWSVVAPQPKPLACTSARRPSSRRRDKSTSSDSTPSVHTPTS